MQGPLITRTKGYYAFFLGEPVFVNGEVSGVLVGAINMDYIASHTIDPVTMHGKGIVYVAVSYTHLEDAGYPFRQAAMSNRNPQTPGL